MATGFPPPPIKSPISKDLVSADWARWFSNLNQGISGSLPIPFTLGDILYASGSLNLAKLPGNITTTRKFLTQTGTGSVSAVPSWRPIGADDIPDAIIINPLVLGRNVIRPASNAIEGLALKAFSSPVSYLATGNWTIKGGGLVFGSTITQNSAGSPQTSYAYAPIADVANLSVTYIYSITDTKNTSISDYVCLGGAGIVGRNLVTTNPPNNQSGTGNPYGAWTSDTVGSIRHFIGGNSDSRYVVLPLIEDQPYSGTITITVGPNKGGNKYDVTIRTQLPFASIDHTEIITDGIDNGGAGTNGYLVISGSYTPAVDNAYSVSSILSGVLPTQKAFEIRKSDNTVNAYLDWDGTGSFYDIFASHQSTLGTVISGIWHGTSIDTAYTDAKIKTVTGTANRLTIGGTSTDPTFNISTAYVGQGTITTLGTIASGVWNGTVVTVPFGGTGVATLATNGILYGNGVSSILALAVNSTATNKFLTQSSSGAPAWATIAAADLPSSFSGLANPSGTIGLSAVNGSATTALRSDGLHALSQAIVPTWSGIHTFTLQPIMSSLTASQAVFSDGSKGLVSNAITGTGNVVMSASPTLTGTIVGSAATFSGKVTSNAVGAGGAGFLVSGSGVVSYGLSDTSQVADGKLWDMAVGGNQYALRVINDALSASKNALLFSRTALVLTDLSFGNATDNPTYTILGSGLTTIKSLTASQVVFSDANKALVSNPITGTGNVVMSASPTLTGVISAAQINLSGRLNVNGASDSASFGINLAGGSHIATSSSGRLYSFGVGLPGAANSESVLIRHSGVLGEIYCTQSGTGTYRDLLLYTGDIERLRLTGTSAVITATADFKLGTVGYGLYIKEGTNATMGVATLVLGTVTVSTTKVTANSRIFLCHESLGTITSPVALAVTGRSAGTSFTITSANLTDTSAIAWVILEPA